MIRLSAVALALLFIVVSHPAMAQSRVDQIVINGAQRVDPETVISYMTFRPGDQLGPTDLDASLRSLFRTGLFSDVVIRQDGASVVVDVVENPIINRIAFEGNRRINDDALGAEIQLRPRVVYTRTRVQSDVARLVEVYRRTGRFAATVEPSIILLDENRVDLVFEIDEGPQTEIQRIAFVGNEAYSDGTLRSEIETSEARFYRLFASTDTYDPERLNVDRELLRRFYVNRGYADFRIVSAVAELTPDRDRFFITYTVEEGERYRFGDVEIASQIAQLDTESLEGSIESRPGDVYSAESVEATIEALRSGVGDQQFAFADVRPIIRRDRETSTINLIYEVAEGPRTFVERIEINGNTRTLDEVIRREFLLVEGDPFSASALRRSEARIRNLGFFSSVSVNAVPGSQPDQTVIQVDVEEQSTGELTLGAGFSTLDGLIGDLSIRERNLLGRGQELRLSARVGLEVQEFDFSFTEPFFLDRDVALTANAFNITRDNQDESSFDSFRFGGAVSVGFPLTPDIRQTVGYRLSFEDLQDVDDDASLAVLEDAGAASTSSVTSSVVYDQLDSRFSPTDGYRLGWTVELAGLGGSERWVSNTFSAAYYTPLPLGEDVILSVRGRAGIIVGLGRDVRLSDRFFIGGTQIRGFANSGIGPRDTDSENDDALGGNQFATGTVEATFPLPVADELGLRGRVFTDFGTLGVIDNNPVGADDGHALRASIGAGLGWLSPFGPINIDLGFPVISEDADEEELVRFSFGTTF